MTTANLTLDQFIKRLTVLRDENQAGGFPADTWDRSAAVVAQEQHALVSRSWGIGAQNNVETSVAKAREVAKLPRPRREASGYRPCTREVARVIEDANEPVSAARIADIIGTEHKEVVDMASVSMAVRALLKAGDIVQRGRNRGAKYQPASNVVAAPPSGPSMLEARGRSDP